MKMVISKFGEPKEDGRLDNIRSARSEQLDSSPHDQSQIKIQLVTITRELIRSIQFLYHLISIIR